MTGVRKQVNGLVEKVLDIKLSQPVYWTDIKDDSRQISPGDAFVALPSYSGKDGDIYIEKAIENGAAFILRDAYNEELSCEEIAAAGKHIPCLTIPNLREKHGEIISHFLGLPSAQVTVIGVTGTNGKTSVVNLISSSLDILRVKCGMIGTLGFGSNPKNLEKISYTTPCAVELHGIINKLVKNESQVCAMEVSSHAIDQGRISGVYFDIGVLTNTSHDHLDYHGTMAEYRSCKEKLFYETPLQHIVINLDDELGERIFLKGHPTATIIAFTFKVHGKRKDVAYCSVTDQSLSGQTISIFYSGQNLKIKSQLTGQYNAENIVTAFLTLNAMGYSPSKIVTVLEQVTHIPGRFEVIHSENGPTVIVDYAHTPDALKNVLMTLQQVTESKIWCVFGCGGDRDRDKRAPMGVIAEKYADYVVLTSDNPRSEVPESIIEDIKKDMIANWAIHQQTDRVEAIRWAIANADSDDVVLVAGKGHETSQIFSTKRIDHSDSDVVKSCLDESRL
tara:strand:+ start:35 stop:1549 length:1515 start_codon:yes stop_codon:yes gene_type:complete